MKRLFLCAALVGASIALLGLGGTAAASSSSVVYNNIPSPQPGNVASEAFEAQSASEFGGQIHLAGTARTKCCPQRPRKRTRIAAMGNSETNVQRAVTNGLMTLTPAFLKSRTFRVATVRP